LAFLLFLIKWNAVARSIFWGEEFMESENLRNARDQELILAIKDSQHRAFEVFFQRHFDKIYHFIWQLIRNDEAANDLAQNTFVKLWEIRHKLQPEKSSRALLQTIARNQAISWLRMPRNRHISIEGFDFPENEKMEESDELARKLHSVIKELDEPLRVVINLRLRGIKDKEIAELLNLSTAAVDKRKTKAFKIIRARLQPFLCFGIIFLKIISW